MRRNTLISSILAGTVVAAGVGWVAGQSIRSPAQIAAQTAPPKASPITVAIDRRVLSADVIVRGTVRYGALAPVTLVPSSVNSTNPILTVAPVAGATLTEGKSAMTVSGRPVFALAGAVPTYRDLTPGVTGGDVRQLQAALVRLGFYPGPVNGVYDGATATAVANWYTRSGFTPFGPTPAQLKTLRSAQATVSQAQDAVFKAQAAINATKGTPLSVVQAVVAQRGAVAALDAATAKATQDAALGTFAIQAKMLAADVASLDAAAAARPLVAAQAGLDPTTGLPAFTPEQQAQLQTTVVEAQRSVVLAQNDLAGANQTLTTDQATLTADQAACTKSSTALACARISADQRQVVSDNSAIQASQVVLANANDALATAQRHLSNAQAGLDPNTGQARVTPISLAKLQDAVTRANDALAQAQSDLAVSRQKVAANEQDDARAVSAARDTLMVSDARLAQARSPMSASLLAEQQHLAAGDLQRANAVLAQVSTTVGVAVPANEVLFFPSLPVRVDAVKLKAGDAISGAVMQVSTAHLAVDSALSLSDATLVRVGAPVTINEPNLGITVPGTVTLVASAPGTNGVDPQHVYIEVTPSSAPAQLVGASVKLTIAVKTTHGKVLAVPISALSLLADGTTRIQVERGGRLVSIPVVPGLGAGGLVEVTPIGVSLAAGDQVLVGTRGASVPSVPPPATPTTTAVMPPTSVMSTKSTATSQGSTPPGSPGG